MKILSKNLKPIVLATAITITGVIWGTVELTADADTDTDTSLPPDHMFVFGTDISDAYFQVYHPNGMNCADENRQLLTATTVPTSGFSERYIRPDPNRQICVSVSERTIGSNFKEVGVSPAKLLENIVFMNSSMPTIRVYADENGYFDFAYEKKTANLTVENIGYMALTFQFYQPDSVDKCSSHLTGAMNPRHELPEYSTENASLEPGHLPLDYPDGNGYVCLYTERGIVKGYYGPFIVTGSNSNCIFKVWSSNVDKEAEQYCES